MAELRLLALSDKERTEFNDAPLKGSSPFSDGTVFNITDAHYARVEIDGKASEIITPVLETTVGTMWLSMLTKGHARHNGTPVYSEGSATRAILEAAEAHKDKASDAFKAILDVTKDKQIRVTRRVFTGLSREGKIISSSVVDLNFVNA